MTVYDRVLVARLIAELREDDAKATPGPWRFDGVDIDQLTDAGKGYPLDVYPDSAVVVDGKCDDCGLRCGIRLEVDAKAIVRTRNRLATVAEQLEAAGAEVDRLRAEASAFDAENTKSFVGMLALRDRAVAERDALRAEVEALRDHERAARLNEEDRVYARAVQEDNERLRADNERMRAVFEAAKAWRDQYEEVMRVNGVAVAHPMHAALLRAVDAALAEHKEKP